MEFDKAFELVLGIEAGYVNDPHDPGGETKFGISKRSYPQENIPAMTLERAKILYRRDYWDKAACDRLPARFRIALFDAAVNQGVKPAVMMLQSSLGTSADGVVGGQTVSAAERASPEAVALYLADRAIRYTVTPNFNRYGRGWMKRLFLIANV